MSFPKVYTVNGPSSTSAASLPSWLTIKTKPTRNAAGQRKRVKTQHQLGSLELIQDFAFPGSAMRVKTTEDGEHVMATGTYKPMIKVWDLDQLAVKFERVTESENVDFQMLSTDWTKSLHLQRDRSLQLHTQGGLHHTVRLPTYGRSLGYHSPSADALVGCTGTEVYRFNLEEGRYMTPLEVARGWGDGREGEVEGVNVVDVNKRHGLWSFGLDGGGGVVEFWDPRSRTALTRLCLPTDSLLPATTIDESSLIAPPLRKLSITSLASHPTDGLSLAVGTSSGHTLLYDLRSPSPFAVKDQGYGEPVIKVDWLRGGGAQEDNGRVISADSKVIKVWGKDDPTTNHLSLHPPNPLTDLHAVPHSGLILAACEAPEMSAYYVPEIGPAPRWAGFLDNVTEEMADDMSAAGKGAYSDYKFVDKQELETLGLAHLVGTSALKPYMHGYFLSLKLYSTARLMANSNSYDEHREKLINARMEAKAESRIRARKEQPKVNKALAERLLRGSASSKKKSAAGDAEVPEGGVLADPRFAELFENPEFEVDEQSREFALLNPATVHNANLVGGAAARKTAVQDEEDDSDKASSGLGESDDDEDEEGSDDEGAEAAEEEEEAEEDDSDDEGDLQQYDPRKLRPGEEKRQMLRHYQYRPQLQSASGNAGAGSSSTSASSSFGQRLHSNKGRSSAAPADPRLDNVLAMRRSGDGGMEMSFVPQGSSKSASGGKGGGQLFDEDNEGLDAQRAARRRDKNVERFGHGLQKGLEQEDGGSGDEGEGGRNGRTKRRHPGRSASKNVFRKR